MKKFLVAILVAVVALTLAACTPGSYDKAVEKMQDAGYTVVGSTCDETEDGVVGSFVATYVDTSNLFGNSKVVTCTLYASSKQAKAAYNNTKNDDGETDAVLAGKWVLAGSEDAIKTFKK